MSKLGIHIIGPPDNHVDWLRELQPAVIKVMDWDSRESLELLRPLTPHLVYRQYTDLTYNDPPEQFVASLPLKKLGGLGLVWEGLNEPIVSSVPEYWRLCWWYRDFGNLMHAQGEQCAAYSFSTGNPVNKMTLPFFWLGLQACDYVALHEYYSQKDGWAMAEGHKYWNQVPTPFRRKCLITECGYDNGGNRFTDGWLANRVSVECYLNILKEGLPLFEDTEGMALFTIGGDWKSFIVDGIKRELLTLK